MTLYIKAGFSGISGQFLCISQGDTARDKFGNEVIMREGLAVTAFAETADEKGNPSYLVASGLVERSLPDTCGSDSRWCLRIDMEGVRRVPDLR